NAAVRLNSHAVLVPGSLPNPSSGKKVEFRDAYLVAIQQEVPSIVSGATPPSQADVEKAINDEKAKIEDPAGGIAIVVNGQVVNPQDVTQRVAERSAKIPTEMRDEVAHQHKMYLGSAVGNVSQTQGGLSPMTDALTVKPEINALATPDDVT